MIGLRRARRFARLLAACLLLSFITMTAAPFGALYDALAFASGSAADDEHCAEAAHPGAHAHSGPVAQPDGSDAGLAHAGHATHCPLCTHAAAPPSAIALAAACGPSASSPPLPCDREVRAASAAPPPGRGPPSFS
jgi:hypothetical protein